MTACHSYSPMKTGAILLLEIQKVSKCTTLSPVALKGLQKDQVHTQTKVQFSATHTIATSKLVAAYCTGVYTYNYCTKSQRSVRTS